MRGEHFARSRCNRNSESQYFSRVSVAVDVRINRKLAETSLSGPLPMPRKPIPSDRPRCAHCDEVIGAYERFVEMIGQSVARETSFRSDPDVAFAEGTSRYHVSCYEARGIA